METHKTSTTETIHANECEVEVGDKLQINYRMSADVDQQECFSDLHQVAMMLQNAAGGLPRVLVTLPWIHPEH